MPVLSEGNNLGDVLKYEAVQFYSRDVLTVPDGQTLVLGAVVGIQTADGKARVLDPAAADGTQVAAGIIVQDSAPSGADEDVPFIVRHAIVSDHALVWPGGISAPETTTAIAQLKAAGIIVRKGA
jgi:hypothetical protein